MEKKFERQPYWRWKIAFYLFMAGTGAGAYLISSLIDLFCGEASFLTKSGVTGGTIFVTLGIPFLIIDLGRKERFFYASLNPRVTWIGRGFYILSFFIILGFIHIGLWIWPFQILELNRSLRLIFSIINGIFAFGVALYTGLLLKSMKSVHFWDTPLIVILFFISAFSTGIVFLIFFSIRNLSESWNKDFLNFLLVIDLILILIEGLVLIFYLITMAGGTEAAKKSVCSLLQGDLKFHFWGGIIFCNLIIPFILNSIKVYGSKHDLINLILISSILSLGGGVFLRYCILAAGVQVTSLIPKCR